MSTMILRAEVIFKEAPSSTSEAIKKLATMIELSPPPSGIGAPPPLLGDLIVDQKPNQMYALGIVQQQSTESLEAFKGYNTLVTIDNAILVATDTLAFGPVSLEFVVAAATENEVTIGASSADTATNLAAAINAHSLLSLLFFASSASDVVTVTFLGMGLEAQLIGLVGSAPTATIVSWPFLLPASVGEVATIIGNPAFTLQPGYDTFAWDSLVGQIVDCIDPATGASRFSGDVTVQAFASGANTVTLSGSVGDLGAIAIADLLSPIMSIQAQQNLISWGGRS